LFIIAKLTSPLFSVFSHEISGRDIILILGGLFLIVKSTLEIHHDTQPNKEQPSTDTSDTSMIIGKNFFYVLMQIALLDVVFSLDSVITAVGMVDNLQVMILAIIIAILLMIIASKKISEFIENNPSIKILALAFLILVGTSLVAEGLEFHIPKGYIYCSMAFSFSVEAINIYKRRQIRA
ncbi:MAG: TerC family protein, partial [Helicobacter sp.]|nr:TerC family protein [Helicobacter sp.]